ncbi:hypothetical protein [Halosegnis marinus]|uniref:hypothetical protein n=1 Tax=Halosegnis marinus TaxID=3034023 RepID=UPI00361F25CB
MRAVEPEQAARGGDEVTGDGARVGHLAERRPRAVVVAGDAALAAGDQPVGEADRGRGAEGGVGEAVVGGEEGVGVRGGGDPAVRGDDVAGRAPPCCPYSPARSSETDSSTRPASLATKAGRAEPPA